MRTLLYVGNKWELLEAGELKVVHNQTQPSARQGQTLVGGEGHRRPIRHLLQES